MSPTSCRCSTPRRVCVVCRCARVRPPRGWGAPAAASPPRGSPPQYSPALRWVTTGFGMGPGGASALSATGAPHPPGSPGGGGAPLRARVLLRPRSRSCPRLRAPCTCPTRLAPLPGRALRASRALRLPLARAAPARVRRHPGLARGWERRNTMGTPPSAIRTARLQSVARGPPAAYRPGHLPGALPEQSVGTLVLGRDSRLDAFSGSPVRTWLPSGAGFPTTGTPAVRPTRSSRTRVSPPQYPDARGG